MCNPSFTLTPTVDSPPRFPSPEVSPIQHNVTATTSIRKKISSVQNKISVPKKTTKNLKNRANISIKKSTEKKCIPWSEEETQKFKEVVKACSNAYGKVDWPGVIEGMKEVRERGERSYQRQHRKLLDEEAKTQEKQKVPTIQNNQTVKTLNNRKIVAIQKPKRKKTPWTQSEIISLRNAVKACEGTYANKDKIDWQLVMTKIPGAKRTIRSYQNKFAQLQKKDQHPEKNQTFISMNPQLESTPIKKTIKASQNLKDHSTQNHSENLPKDDMEIWENSTNMESFFVSSLFQDSSTENSTDTLNHSIVPSSLQEDD